ncbi:Hypothetical predicted protein [Cloeon dipterum]|uniref:EGF-like domain-containing protein n=2 Tax=Cloeon dipterum TaxID=197152 RepID=A0A8S1CB78_9INSE|nr:Hypothetical predicted protein [Cloeon dipterum]
MTLLRAVCAVFLVCTTAGVTANVKKPIGPLYSGREYHHPNQHPEHPLEVDDAEHHHDHGDPDFPEGQISEHEKSTCVCPEKMFACQQSCLCVPQEWRCDGDADCEHGEDEHCDPLHRSGGGGGTMWEGPSDVGHERPTEPEPDCRGLHCPSGRCISREWLCDGDDDCGDFWDEASCGFDMNCTAEEFQCENGLCVQLNWVCDGDNDCKDFSDESNCTANSKCAPNEFRCGDGTCISENWRCDSESDCLDNSDEADCDFQPPVCQEDEFQCSYPRCVNENFRCDGNDDCGDWSDEENCPSQPYRSCRVGEYKCNSGKCIPERWLCDDESDCDNAEDEENCEKKKPRTCGPDEFSCSHGNCILKSWLCDGVEDCPKGEDEQQCTPSCEETQFACSNSSTSCISRKHMCDGKRDCPHGEDEKDCPIKKECDRANPKKCEQLCVTEIDGKDGCACRFGYTLQPNGYACRDIDECSTKLAPPCSQTCLNTIGSFTCSCKEGYILRSNGRSCKALGPPAILLFANRVDIRQMSLNNVKYTAILKGLHNAIALDYHYHMGLVYWSDVSLDMIRRAHINGSEPEDVIRWGLEAPSGVALDWVHNLLFWTDSGTRRVEVASLDGSVRSVLAASDLDKPRAIAVHPGEALVFWTDWGPNPKIESCQMDGSNRKAIITESVFWPNGLTIDFAVDRIYWADAKHHVIENARFDGRDRKKVISKGLPHPFALTVFEDFVYWTDWHTKSISSANKVTGSGFRTVHSGLHFPMDIHSYHPQRQPNYSNRCLGNNGGCSHLCLPNSDSFTCVCPLGQRLELDRKMCKKVPEKLLLFARSRDLRIHLLDGVEPQVDMVIPVDDVQSATALDWDSNTDELFWADAEANTISRAALNGSNQRLIVSSNLESPAGIAVDWVTKKLYWTDAGTNRIEVANLDGTMRALLIWEGIEKLRDITVNPNDGYMYWSDWGETPKIEKAGMDGSARKVLISQRMMWPNGLTIDQDTRRLYWADGGAKTIEYCNFDGSGRNLIGSALPYPFGLAVYKESVYWTDWDTTSIHKADKTSGKNMTVLKSGITGLMDVQVFHRDRKLSRSDCHFKNGGCSHLCLLAPSPKKFSCACPIGIKILEDNKKCADGPTNSLIFAHRVDIRRISLDVPYVIDVVLPLPPMHNAVAVDVDRKTGEIYWSDTVEDVIRKGKDNGSDVQDVIIDSLDNVEGIVVDSTGRKIYWTDGGRHSIEVAELDGSNRKVLICKDLDSPRAITLHYHRGLMFWSSWGKKPSIERASMDGSNRSVIIHEHVNWPNGLAIDRPAGRLYWNDGKMKTIESSTLDGTDRRLILGDVPHPYGLVVVGTHIYWTDWQTEALHRAEKENGADRVIIRDRLQGLMTIRSVQADNIAENACGHNNGDCSHLCLRTESSFVCACPTGILMGPDGRTCNNTPHAYLLFATRSALARVSLDSEEQWDVTLPIPGVHTAVAVDFHWEKQIIIYTDIHLDVIRQVDMNNFSNFEDIIFNNLSTPTGVAVDWIANNIYWTDTSRKALEVARLDGSCRKLLIHDKVEDPRALTVFPRKGFLYWTEWGDSPKIERSYLDGSARRVIIGTELGFPNGLALDYTANRLFWADALRDRIETSDLHGRGRTQLVPEATHPIGLTQFGPHVYWTDWYKKSVERADKLTGSERTAIRTNLNGVMEIRAVAADQQQGWTPCAEENGHCSHLCFHRPQGYICQCPDVPDKRPCSTKPSFLVSLRDEESEDDEGEYDTGDLPGLSKRNGRESPSSAGLLLMAGSFLFLLLCALVLVAMLRRRYKHNLYTGRNVLTFANPNYNASEAGGPAGPGGPNAADRRPFLWKKLKCEKTPSGSKGVGSGGASTPSSSSHQHEEGIILCAVPELKTAGGLHHAIAFDAVTTSLDDKHDEIYSEITVPSGSAK